MGNFAGGVRSALSKVGARCPVRNSPAEAQSLNPRPFFSKPSCSLGTANAPSASTGASFSNSRRLFCRNFFSSIFMTRSSFLFFMNWPSTDHGLGQTSRTHGIQETLRSFAPTRLENHNSSESGAAGFAIFSTSFRGILAEARASKMSDLDTIVPNEVSNQDRALPEEPQRRASQDPKQRKLMLGSLCLLLLALGIVIWR